MSERVGILGGTFDPIHVGHLAAAEAAGAALDLTRLLIIPTRTPPHRPMQPIASTYHRFTMAALAAADRPAYRLSDLEVSGPGPSYTAHTLRRLHASGHPAASLFFIVGADAFADITSWHDYPAILNGCHYVVVTRPGHPQQALRDHLPMLTSMMHVVPPRLSALPALPSIVLVDAVTPDVSSSRIRRLLADGGSVAGMLPPGVEAYARKHELYSRSTMPDAVIPPAPIATHEPH